MEGNKIIIYQTEDGLNVCFLLITMGKENKK